MCVCSYNCGRLCHTRHLGHSPPVLHHVSCCCCHTGQSPLCTDSLPRSNCFLNLDRIRSAVTGQLCEEMDLRNSLLCLKRCYCAIADDCPSSGRIVKLQNFLPRLLSKLGQFCLNLRPTFAKGQWMGRGCIHPCLHQNCSPGGEIYAHVHM